MLLHGLHDKLKILKEDKNSTFTVIITSLHAANILSRCLIWIVEAICMPYCFYELNQAIHGTSSCMFHSSCFLQVL